MTGQKNPPKGDSQKSTRNPRTPADSPPVAHGDTPNHSPEDRSHNAPCGRTEPAPAMPRRLHVDDEHGGRLNRRQPRKLSQSIQHEASHRDHDTSQANDPAGGTAMAQRHANNSVPSTSSSKVDDDDDDDDDDAPTGGNSGGAEVTAAAVKPPAEASNSLHTSAYVPSSAELPQQHVNEEDDEFQPAAVDSGEDIDVSANQQISGDVKSNADTPPEAKLFVEKVTPASVNAGAKPPVKSIAVASESPDRKFARDFRNVTPRELVKRLAEVERLKEGGELQLNANAQSDPTNCYVDGGHRQVNPSRTDAETKGAQISSDSGGDGRYKQL